MFFYIKSIPRPVSKGALVHFITETTVTVLWWPVS